MYCKKCGKEIPEDSTFCKFCGCKQEEVVTIKTNSPIKVDIDAQIGPKVNLGWIKRISSTNKKIIGAYLIWFLTNCLLLISGNDHSGFFPHIYTEKQFRGYYSHAYDEVTKISWDVKYYGFFEFVVYVVFIPVVIGFAYYIYNERKANNKLNKPNP